MDKSIFSGQTRMSNGRFVKDKVKIKRLKALKAMMKSREEKKVVPAKVNTVCEGKRIIDINELANNLECSSCQKVLSLKNITNEKHLGLHSTLSITCSNCLLSNVVHTGKMIKVDNKSYSNINLSAVLGAVHSGAGCDKLNQIFACLNVPTVSKDLFKRYEQVVYGSKAAKESCKRAGGGRKDANNK